MPASQKHPLNAPAGAVWSAVSRMKHLMQLRYNSVYAGKVDEILQTAKKLKRAQIERLIEKLDEHLEALDEKQFARTKGPLYA